MVVIDEAGKMEELFQYPQSDRRRCNDDCEKRWLLYSVLSVSSIGSEAMQQGWDIRKDPATGELSVSSIGSEAMQPWHPQR